MENCRLPRPICPRNDSQPRMEVQLDQFELAPTCYRQLLEHERFFALSRRCTATAMVVSESHVISQPVVRELKSCGPASEERPAVVMKSSSLRIKSGATKSDAL